MNKNPPVHGSTPWRDSRTPAPAVPQWPGSLPPAALATLAQKNRLAEARIAVLFDVFVCRKKSFGDPAPANLEGAIMVFERTDLKRAVEQFLAAKPMHTTEPWQSKCPAWRELLADTAYGPGGRFHTERWAELSKEAMREAWNRREKQNPRPNPEGGEP